MNFKKYKKSLSPVISVVLIISIIVVMVIMFSSFAKNDTRDKLDDASDSLSSSTNLNCSNKIQVKECTIDYFTKDVNLLVDNLSDIIYRDIRLTLDGKNYQGDSISVTGSFNKTLNKNSSIFLSTKSNFSYKNENLNYKSLDIDNVDNFILSSKKCPSDYVYLDGCKVIYSKSSVFGSFLSSYFNNNNLEIKESRNIVNNTFFENKKLNKEEYDGDFAFSQSTYFDGNDDYITINNDNDFNFNHTQNFTLSLWVNPKKIEWNSPFTGRGIIGNSDYKDGGYGIGIYKDNSIRFKMHSNPDLSVSNDGTSYSIGYNYSDFKLNDWIHLTLVYDSNIMKGYINSEKVREKEAILGYSINNFRIGYLIQGGWINFNGSISDVRIYNRALNISEIKDVYEGNYIDTNGLVGFWPLSEGNGDTVYDAMPYSNNLIKNNSFEIDSDQDGLANDWKATYNDESFSLVTGNGFSNYAQRLEGTEYTHRALRTVDSMIEEGETYKINFKYRSYSSDGIISLYEGVGKTISVLQDNLGNAKEFSIEYTATSDDYLMFYIKDTGDSNAFIEVDDVSIKKLQRNNGSINLGTKDNITLEDFWSKRQDFFHYNLLKGFSSSLYFDGENDYILVPSSSSLEFDENISTCAKINTISQERYLGILKKHNWNVDGFNLFLSYGKTRSYIHFDGDPHSFLPTSNDLRDGEWHIICKSTSDQNRWIFVDDSFYETIPIFYHKSVGTDLIFGDSIGFYKGFIKDIIIWDKQINESDINNYKNNSLNLNSDNIVGYWKLNHSDKNVVYDYSKYNNDGVLNNFDENSGFVKIPRDLSTENKDVLGNDLTNPPNETHNQAETNILPTQKLKLKDYSLTFDGDGDYVNLPIDSIKDFGTNDNFSISVWAKPKDSYNFKTIFSHGYGAHSYGRFLLAINDSKPFVSLYTGSTSTGGYRQITGTQSFLDEWVYLTAVFNRDENKIQLYVNSRLDGEIDWSGYIENTTNYPTNSGIHIGAMGYYNYPTKYFNGSLSDLRLYNKVLTEIDIKKIYNSRELIDENKLYAHYPFSEGSGDKVYDKINGYDGNIIDLGPELVTNPYFSGNLDGWDTTGWHISSNGDYAEILTTDSSPYLTQEIEISPLKKYIVYTYVRDLSSGHVELNLGGDGSAVELDSLGVKKYTILPDSQNSNVELERWGCDANIDSVSVREIIDYNYSKFWENKQDIYNYDFSESDLNNISRNFNKSKSTNFDGVDDYIEVENYDMGITDEITTTAWVYLTEDSFSSYKINITSVWNTGAEPGSNQWALSFDSGSSGDIPYNPKFFVEIGNDSYSVASENSININQWYHITGVKDQNSLKIYIDGNLSGVNENVFGNINYVPERKFYVSSFYNRGSLIRSHGAKSDVRVYNKALDENQINNIYKGLDNNYDNLSLWLPLEEGFGEIAYNAIKFSNNLLTNSDCENDLPKYNSSYSSNKATSKITDELKYNGISSLKVTQNQENNYSWYGWNLEAFDNPKKIRVKAKVYLPSNSFEQIKLRMENGDISKDLKDITTKDEWVDVDLEYNYIPGTNHLLYFLGGYSSNIGDYFYLDDISIQIENPNGEIKNIDQNAFWKIHKNPNFNYSEKLGFSRYKYFDGENDFLETPINFKTDTRKIELGIIPYDLTIGGDKKGVIIGSTRYTDYGFGIKQEYDKICAVASNDSETVCNDTSFDINKGDYYHLVLETPDGYDIGDPIYFAVNGKTKESTIQGYSYTNDYYESQIGGFGQPSFKGAYSFVKGYDDSNNLIVNYDFSRKDNSIYDYSGNNNHAKVIGFLDKLEIPSIYNENLDSSKKSLDFNKKDFILNNYTNNIFYNSVYPKYIDYNTLIDNYRNIFVDYNNNSFYSKNITFDNNSISLLTTNDIFNLENDVFDIGSVYNISFDVSPTTTTTSKSLFIQNKEKDINQEINLNNSEFSKDFYPFSNNLNLFSNDENGITTNLNNFSITKKKYKFIDYNYEIIFKGGVPSFNNNSLYLDGNNDYIHINNEFKDKNLENITILLSFKTNDLDSGLFSKYYNSDTYSALLKIDSGLLVGCVSTVDLDQTCKSDIYQVNSSTQVNDNNYHFVALIYDGSNVKLYIDDEIEDSYSKSGDIVYNNYFNNSNFLGVNGFFIDYKLNNLSNYFNGYIKYFEIFDRALSPQEINTLKDKLI